jgi:hypothetical protein
MITADRDEIVGLFVERVPSGWFTGPPVVDIDADEILVVGSIAADASATDFRESTRAERMAIASEAESRFGRKVSWGVTSGATTTLFTSVSVPVMTRLRIRERALLDTLVEGGVARSRSEALAWCVRLVGQHEAEWVTDLREALVGVRKARAEGPALI